MKRLYSVLAVFWILIAAFVGTVVGSADGQQVSPSCGSAHQPWTGE
jgi:hypothetical protein